MSKKKGRPKRRTNFSPLAPKPKAPADGVAQKHFKWSFRDFDDYEWGRATTVEDLLEEVIPKLQDFETQRWGTIEGKNNHFCDLTKSPNNESVKRLRELKREDPHLFSLRLSGKMRLWGYRYEAVFHILWFDPDHQVYPSTIRHT